MHCPQILDWVHVSDFDASDSDSYDIPYCLGILLLSSRCESMVKYFALSRGNIKIHMLHKLRKSADNSSAGKKVNKTKIMLVFYLFWSDFA